MEIHTDDYVSVYYTDLFSERRLMGTRSHADRRFWYAANNYVEFVRRAVMDDFGTLVDVSGAANPLLKEQ